MLLLQIAGICQIYLQYTDYYVIIIGKLTKNEMKREITQEPFPALGQAADLSKIEGHEDESQLPPVKAEPAIKGPEPALKLEGETAPKLPVAVLKKDIVHPTRGKVEKVTTDPGEYSGEGVA